MTAPRAVKAVALVACSTDAACTRAQHYVRCSHPRTTRRELFLSETEIGSCTTWRPNHQQALFILARLSPDVDPAVTRLAQQIDDVQRTEIGVMLGWLRLAGAPPNSRTPMAWMEASPSGAGDSRHHPATLDTETDSMPWYGYDRRTRETEQRSRARRRGPFPSTDGTPPPWRDRHGAGRRRPTRERGR